MRVRLRIRESIQIKGCLLGALLVSLLCLGGCGEDDAMDEPQDAAFSIVQIQNGEVSGSGVLWRMQGNALVVATAAHVLTMGDGDVRVTLWDGRTAGITGYELTDKDLVFLLVDRQELSKGQTVEYPVVDVDVESASKLQNGDEIVLMAVGAEGAVETRPGEVLEAWIYVEFFAQHMIVARVDAQAGMSGGGLFDREGHFLGILCGKSEDGEVAVIPLSVMEALYNQISETI